MAHNNACLGFTVYKDKKKEPNRTHNTTYTTSGNSLTISDLQPMSV